MLPRFIWNVTLTYIMTATNPQYTCIQSGGNEFLSANESEIGSIEGHGGSGQPYPVRSDSLPISDKKEVLESC